MHNVFQEEMCGAKGQTFLTNLILTESPWPYPTNWIRRKITYLPFVEFPFSRPLQRKNSAGRAMASVRFVDVVYFVANGKSAAYHGELITVGIEIKTNLIDLLRDEKMGCYIGKTNYTFLAVPDGLISDALEKVQNYQGMGVCSLVTGAIIKNAQHFKVVDTVYKQSVLRALLSAKHLPHTFTIENTLRGVPDRENTPNGVYNNSTTIKTTTKRETTMNFVGNRKPEVRTPRFELKNGKITRWIGSDQPVEVYDYCEGILLGIDLRRRDTRNGEMVYCDFHFRNGEDLFDISTIASSGVTADLVSRLKNVKDPAKSTIRIDAWQNNKYTNVFLKENGRPVVHANLPRVQKIDRGVKVECDSSERDAAVMAIIEDINARIQNGGRSGER